MPISPMAIFLRLLRVKISIYLKETGALLLSNQSRAAGALRMFPGSPLIKTTPHPKIATCHSFGSESFKAKQPHVSPEASRVTLSEIMT